MLTLKRIQLGLAALALALSAAPASAAVITAASLDFDSPFTVYSGIFGSFGAYTSDTANGSYNGANGKSWSGNIATSQDTSMVTLSLTGLPTHTEVSIDFMLGFLNSWDSTNGTVSPDYLDMYIDGVLVQQLTTAIASGSATNYGGGTLLVDNGQIDSNFSWSDDLVDMATASFLTFAHTGPTLTVSWQPSGAGYQSYPDEYWGIDDISVRLTVPGGDVPEPGTLLLLGFGMAGLAGLRRRRNTI